MKRIVSGICWLVVSVLVLSGCRSARAEAKAGQGSSDLSEQNTAPELVEFTLQTGAENGRMVYIGVGGDIDGLINPDLVVQPGAKIKITLVNGHAMAHDLTIPDFNAKTPVISSQGQTAEIIFTVSESQSGTFPYYCSQPGHRQAGQEGRLIVGVSGSRSPPTALPG